MSAKKWLFYLGFHVLTLPKLNWTRDFRKNMGPSQYQDLLSRYGDSNDKDKTIMRPSYS